MSTYEACGNIRLVLNCGGESVILFTPNNDHAIKHGGKSCAVFVSQKDDQIDGSIIREGDTIDISLGVFADPAKELFSAIASAATTQIKVGVAVKQDGDKLTLVGITIPAK